MSNKTFKTGDVVSYGDRGAHRVLSSTTYLDCYWCLCLADGRRAWLCPSYMQSNSGANQ